MCESCKNSAMDEIFKTIAFGGVRYVLYSKPIKGAVDKIETTVGIPSDSSMGSTTHKKGKGKKKHMKMLMMDSVVYLVSAILYDNYLYELILKKIELFKKDYGGFCPCELMKMLYLLAVQIAYDAIMSGASIRKALADVVAIFGAESLGNRLIKMYREKKSSSLVMPMN